VAVVIAAVAVFVGVLNSMFVAIMLMIVPVAIMVMAVIMMMVVMVVMMTMVMVVFMFQVHVELDARDALTFLLADMQVIAVELELLQLVRELVGVHAEVDERGDEHVAGDAAEDVEVKGFHHKFILLLFRETRKTAPETGALPNEI